MNSVEITQYDNSRAIVVNLELTPVAEANFKAKVFPVLFDGKTSGVRTEQPNGMIRYTLLVYEESLIFALKTCLYNAILTDQGQLN